MRDFRTRNVFFLGMVEIFWGIALAFSHAKAVLPAYLADLGGANAAVGALTAVWIVGGSLPQVLSGYFTEHLRARKRAVMVFHFLPAVAWLALFVFNEHFVAGPADYGDAIAFFMIAVCVYECSLGLLLPMYLDFLSRVLAPETRGQAFGTIFSTQCVFGAWAVSCVGFLLAGRPFPGNYALLFLLTFVSICAGNLFFIPVKERTDEAAAPRRRVLAYLRSFAAIWGANRLLRRYAALRVLVALNMVLAFFFTKHAKSTLDWLDITHVRHFVVFLLVGQAAGNVALGRVGDRFGFKAVALIGAGVMFGATAVCAGLGSLAGFYLVMGAAGFYLAADWISHSNFVLMVCGGENQTSSLGLVGALTSVPLACASLTLGCFMDLFSFAAVAVATSALAGAGTVLLAFTRFSESGREPCARV